MPHPPRLLYMRGRHRVFLPDFLLTWCTRIAYGCTETSSCISQSGVRDVSAPLVATGTILPNIGIRFLDEQLRDVAIGQTGEIAVSSPTIMM